MTDLPDPTDQPDDRILARSAFVAQLPRLLSGEPLEPTGRPEA